MKPTFRQTKWSRNLKEHISCGDGKMGGLENGSKGWFDPEYIPDNQYDKYENKNNINNNLSFW